jgi:hypothetical protein
VTCWLDIFGVIIHHSTDAQRMPVRELLDFKIHQVQRQANRQFELKIKMLRNMLDK